MKKPSAVQLEYWEKRLADYGLGMRRGESSNTIYIGGIGALETQMYPRDGEAPANGQDHLRDGETPRRGRARRIAPQVQRFFRDNHGPVTR